MGVCVGLSGRFSFSRRATVLVACVLVAVFAVYSVWSVQTQRAAAEQKACDEARLLARQMEAAWDYIDAMQGRINYNSNGAYDFKGVYCSVAAKSIARRFTNTTDCVIRYTRENPRTGTDAPDEFEAEALAAFAGGTDGSGTSDGPGEVDEYYAVTAYEGAPALRYLSAIRIKNGCLTCHGEPAGELDETGFPREGLAVGDLAGAASIVIPMASFEEEALQRTVSDVGLFALCLACVVGCMAVAGSALRRGRAEVEQANARLEAANEALRKESAYKSTFLSTMSHELRTPVASTLALADVWERTAGRSASPDEARIVETIRRNSANLLETVNNTLDAAKIDARRYPVALEEVDLVDLLGEIEEVVSPLAAQQGVRLRIEFGPDVPIVRTDPEILRKIATNLLSNAVKFTQAGGSIRLAATWEYGVLSIAVSDTGIGISPEEAQVVFERFRQADSSISRRYGGSGLGLSLVREMAELLGGTARVESELGVGSTFTVELPCGEVELPCGTAGDASGAAGAAKGDGLA